MSYDPHIREEELKNLVAADLFQSFDWTASKGDIQHSIAISKQPLRTNHYALRTKH